MQRWVSSARINVAALLLLAAAAGSCVDSTGPAALTAPRNVTVTLISPHSARISWTPADAPEVYYVETYFIYRDGAKIGESVTTSFTDNGLSEGTTYKYRVAAVGVGLTSEQSVESATSAITIPDVTAPTVTSTNPLNGATAVSRAATISATFSEPIDQATLTATTFSLKTSGGTTIPGAVTYTPATRTAAFTPSGPLPNATTFTATVTTGVKDVAGNRLASDFSFSLTTRDEVPPTVTSMTPANGSTGIPVNTGINVTFSEPMDGATIGSSITLQITSSGVSVPGTVTYAAGSLTANFVPSAALAFSTSYTLTATTSAKDVSGNPLAASVSSVFTTAGAPDTTPPSVLTISPVSGAADVSINTTVTILFSESMDAGSVSSSTVLLKATSNGSTIPATVSLNAATNTATVTPSAPLSFGTQYSVVVTTGAKDAAGNPLAAQFTSSFTTASAPDTTPPSVVSITPANGLNGVSVFTSVTVVFSEPMNAASINGSSISLALTSNSSPVAGTVSYNVATNTATFTPSGALAFSTGYTISVSTAATDLSGNPLSAGATSTFSTASAPDLTPPSVVSVSPPHLAPSVSPSTTIVVVFSEPMNPSSINGSTLFLSFTGTSSTVPGTISYNPATNTATFTPSSALAFSTSYTINVSGMTDLAGNLLAVPVSSIFATGPAPDTTPPTVSSSNPADGATGIARTVAPTVTFSEAMTASTINGSTILLSSGGTPVSGTVTYDVASRTATFTPSSQLSFATSYTLTVTTGVQDVAGNPIAAQFTAIFATVPDPDTTKPTVIDISPPALRDPQLENRSFVDVTFSEPMNAATLTTSSFTVRSNQTGNLVPGTVSYIGATNTARFTPSSPLGYQESGQGNYTVTVTTAAADLAGNTLASDFVLVVTRLPYYQGTSSENDGTKAQIHMHVTFSQNGNTLGRSVECQPLPGADCALLPRNQAAVDAVGPLDDTAGGTIGIAATITALSGTLSGSSITFNFTLANGRTFTFTGTMPDVHTMSGTLSGATLAGPVPITLSRF